MKNVILSSIDLNELVNLLTNNIEDIIQRKKEVVIKQVNSLEQKNENLTRKEVAEMCKVTSLTTLWNWEQKGKLVPKRKAGRKPLYQYQDVIDFLENKRGGQNV